MKEIFINLTITLGSILTTVFCMFMFFISPSIGLLIYIPIIIIDWIGRYFTIYRENKLCTILMLIFTFIWGVFCISGFIGFIGYTFNFNKLYKLNLTHKNANYK